jgi:lipopolysaccharide export system permease protein
MKTLSLYVARTTLSALAITLVLLVGIELIFGLVNELRFVGKGDYGLSQAFTFLLLSMPQNIYQMFPMAALVGSLMGLGQLATRSELIVMQAAGLSPQKITLQLMKFAFVVAFLVWCFGEGVAPHSEKLAQNLKARSLSGGQTLRTPHGTWMRQGKEFIHIQEMHVGGHLEGITRYNFSEDMDLKKSSYASYADYINDSWVLYDIHETNFLTEKTTSDYIVQEYWEKGIDPNILQVVGVKYLDELSLVGLLKTIHYRKDNDLDPKPYQLALWQKIVQPLAVLVMMFIGAPAVFGPLRNATMGFKLFIGMLIGFGFHTVNELFGPLTLVYQISPIIGATLPTLAFFVLGMILMRRVS